jgi:hypothetical protein
MELVRKRPRWDERPRSIEEVVAREVESTTTDGVAERAQSTAEKAGQMLGRLIEKLHERGVINDEFVLDFLDDDYTPYTQPDSRKESP